MRFVSIFLRLLGMITLVIVTAAAVIFGLGALAIMVFKSTAAGVAAVFVGVLIVVASLIGALSTYE